MLATMFALFVPPAHAVSLVLVIGDSCVVSRVDSILIHVGFKGNAGCHATLVYLFLSYRELSGYAVDSFSSL